MEHMKSYVAYISIDIIANAPLNDLEGQFCCLKPY